MQEILELLETMGLGENLSWQDVPNITGAQIGEALADQYGSGVAFNEGLFQTIGLNSMQNLLSKTYSPFMVASQQPLLANLISKSGGKEANTAAGGFAGSGGYQQFQGQVKDVYGKGMAETLSGIAQQRSQQQASIMDLIDQWRQTAAGLTYPGSSTSDDGII